ncbi:MAG: AbrB/MazE/SpoVT family DNA-binding domain-containing protein [Bdellovibrionales bacterium]|nr:AbrB/MazE/SpoVT family DNA-binding domain-containing protein [Bdellovibrionales bacterium]
MPVKIQKWGNSLGVRIPKTVIEKVNLSENSEVEIESKNGTIVIFPAKKEYSLDSLLEQITKNNLHSEEDFKTEGNEVW